MTKKRIHLNRKQKIVFSAMVLLVVSVSVMSLAFFSSTDTVDNTVHSQPQTTTTDSVSTRIKISEPNWDTTGKDLAKRIVPGIVLPKDPLVTNTSSDDISLYIRMKIEVLDENGNLIEDSDRMYAILDSLYYYSDTDTTQKFITIEDSTITCNNPKFFYYDGYYYYSSNKDTLISIGKGESTVRLFDEVQVPSTATTTIDGTEQYIYDLYFSEGFSIKVSAEAIQVPTEKTAFGNLQWSDTIED